MSANRRHHRLPPDIAQGFVLAGGASSRMGTDKALLPFLGIPLVEYALAILRAAGLSPSIAGARSSLTGFAPVIPDSVSGHGPLAGISSALASCSASRAVFLSVDSPCLPPALVALLLHQAIAHDAAIAVARFDQFTHTFPVVVSRSALPALLRSLHSGRGGCLAAFRSAAHSLGRPFLTLSVEDAIASGLLASPPGTPADWFINLNTPADLAHAQSILPKK